MRNAVKQQHFGWSVRNKRGKVLVQRFWKDTGTYERKVLPIKWESGITLEVLSALKKNKWCNELRGINLKGVTENPAGCHSQILFCYETEVVDIDTWSIADDNDTYFHCY